MRMLNSKVPINERNQANSNFLIRTQFAFRANDYILHLILGFIADNGTSITGYFQNKYKNINIVKLVVGPPGSVNPNDIRIVRKILSSLGVRFKEEKVIQIIKTVPGTPGVIRSIFNSLWRKVIVKSIYLGEETAIFVNSTNIVKAILILKQNNII